jgi:hypothetical protein
LFRKAKNPENQKAREKRLKTNDIVKNWEYENKKKYFGWKFFPATTFLLFFIPFFQTKR